MTPGQLRRLMSRVRTAENRLEVAMLTLTALASGPNERTARDRIVAAHTFVQDAQRELERALAWSQSDHERARRR